MPYEYGRAKDTTPSSLQASCWWDNTTLKHAKPPEYLHLGDIHDDESAICSWLHDQKQQSQLSREAVRTLAAAHSSARETADRMTPNGNDRGRKAESHGPQPLDSKGKSWRTTSRSRNGF